MARLSFGHLGQRASAQPFCLTVSCFSWGHTVEFHWLLGYQSSFCLWYVVSYFPFRLPPHTYSSKLKNEGMLLWAFSDPSPPHTVPRSMSATFPCHTPTIVPVTHSRNGRPLRESKKGQPSSLWLSRVWRLNPSPILHHKQQGVGIPRSAYCLHSVWKRTEASLLIPWRKKHLMLSPLLPHRLLRARLHITEDTSLTHGHQCHSGGKFSHLKLPQGPGPGQACSMMSISNLVFGVCFLKQSHWIFRLEYSSTGWIDYQPKESKVASAHIIVFLPLNMYV